MATIRLIPSTYSVSNTQYLSVSNADNMYNNTDNTTYATCTNSRSNTTTYYLYIRGFNFDDVPEDVTINSFTIKIKAYESGVSTSTTYRPYLVNNTTTLTGSCDVLSTSAQTLEFTGLSDDWETIKGYGSNFGIRLTNRRNSRYTTSYLYIYGAEILVDYTPNVRYTVNTSIINGTLTSPTSTSIEVDENGSVEFLFNANEGYEFSSMTVNGTSVTPIEKTIAATKPTITASTEMSAYHGTIDVLLDGSSSTYFESYSTMAAGDYVLFTFSDTANLNSIVCQSGSYSLSGCVLQSSTDGNSWIDIGNLSGSSSSETFNNLNIKGIKYVRIYASSSPGSYFQMYNVTFDYEAAAIGGTYLSYTISNITADVNVVIIFDIPSALYLKIEGTWQRVMQAYKKENGQWVKFDYTYDENKKLVYLGSIETDYIGEVTDDYAITITDGSVPNDTYYFYYEDANKSKLTDWGMIGSTEFNGYNGGTDTTGKHVGEIADDNSISLTDTTLASGTYTMYYEDADGNKLTDWGSIGTISK